MSGDPTSRGQWLAARRSGLGSSDTPVLLLEPAQVHGRTPMDLYLDKVGAPANDDTDEDTPDFRRGRTYEPLAVELYQAQHPDVVVHRPRTPEERYSFEFFWSSSIPWAFANLDGWIQEPDGSIWILEVKAPRPITFDRIARTQSPLPYHRVQCQHLALVGSRRASFVDDCPPESIRGTRLLIYDCVEVDLLVFDLPHDPSIQEEIQRRGEAFWNQHVVPRIPPLEAMAPYAPAVVIPADPKAYVAVEGPAWADTEAAWVAARRTAALADADQKRWDGLLGAALRDAGLERALLPAGNKVIYVHRQGRTTTDWEALQRAHPEVKLDLYAKRGAPHWEMRAYLTKEHNHE